MARMNLPAGAPGVIGIGGGGAPTDQTGQPSTAAASQTPSCDNSHSEHPHQPILSNLAAVERSLHALLDSPEVQAGAHGFISREWGFSAPGGLGPRLGGKFRPWEDKLGRVADFFWEVERYARFEDEDLTDAAGANAGEKDGKGGDPQCATIASSARSDVPNIERAEQLPGNVALRRFILQAPPTEVQLTADDLAEYRTAARIFILLGTLAHLCGNAADPGAREEELRERTVPAWIEEPLVRVAERLGVEPCLSAHFVSMENWAWRPVPGPAEGQAAAVAGERQRMAAAVRVLRTQVAVRDRRYRLKTYRGCFVASEAVDALIEAGLAGTREDAVRLGRRLNEVGPRPLFEHVLQEHLFNDDYLFFCFVGQDMMEAAGASGGGKHLSKHIRWEGQETDDTVDEVETAITRDTQERNEEENERDAALIARFVAAMRRVTVKDRRYHLKVYKKCFLAMDLIDLLVKDGLCSTRQEAVDLGRRVNRQYGLFEHVCNEHQLEDAHLFFRFTGSGDLSSHAENGTTAVRKIGADIAEPALANSVPKFGKRSKAERPRRFRSPRQILAFRNVQKSDTVGEVISSPSPNFQDFLDSSLDMQEFEPDKAEFRLDNIELLYPAFQNNHERVNQLVPACMGYALRALPYNIVDVIGTMHSLLEARICQGEECSENNDNAQEDISRLSDLLYRIAFDLSRCKEQFQLMSTDPTKRFFNSKHVSIRQTQPLSNGVLVRQHPNDEPVPTKGVSGVQFPYFHILDWMLGRYQFQEDEDLGLIGKFSTLDECYPRSQRDFIKILSGLNKESTLRGLLNVIGRPPELMTAYNHLIECYAGEGGVLAAHSRKLYSYIHNDVQGSTSGTHHANATASPQQAESGCPFHSANASVAAVPVRPMSKSIENHRFASMMFRAMKKAADERWSLRMPPLMVEVEKTVHSHSALGGFTTVALDLGETGSRYEYGDVVRVVLPNDEKTTAAWIQSLLGQDECRRPQFFKLKELEKLDVAGWTWAELWEALGWRDDDNNGMGVSLEDIALYIEQARVSVEAKKTRWINSPLDLNKGGKNSFFAVPPPIDLEQLASLVPVSPRIYSVAGCESGRVFLFVSKPPDGGRHHGYERLVDPTVKFVHCAFSPATFFLVPPTGVNLVMVASGTGISPFVGLSGVIGSRPGMYTIAHQCKSSDLFLANCQQWLDFTACNPGAVVMGYISGDNSRRNLAMRYIIRNGKIDETTLLGGQSSSAYYFRCSRFLNRIRETYKRGEDDLNLAYCCGGVRSAIMPLKNMSEAHGWNFEFTVESYGVAESSRKNDYVCQIGGAVVDLRTAAPVHQGGAQILQQIQRIALVEQTPTKIPDVSDVFWQVHPHAYNLLRCMRAPFDADFEAFVAFLEAKALSKRTVASEAEKYAQVALESPHLSKVLRIATELQSHVIQDQVASSDFEGAKKAATTLEALLDHIPNQDDMRPRWKDLLVEYRRKSIEG